MEALETAPRGRTACRRDPTQVLQIVEEIYHIKDLDTLLEKVLFEARNFVNAEAGTLYLAAGRHLYFSYVQNEALFRTDRPKDKYTYSNKRLPIDKNSLAGYVAATGDSLLIDNVYDISSKVAYHFNPDFDKKTSYKTQSILVVPLETTDHLILGVLQLINAKSDEGLVIPFSMQDRLYITEFARNAANAIERAKLSREMVLRMVELAELRDPYETSQHAKRVGAYSIELYEAWALRHGVEDRKIKQEKEILRNAAILHDVGKVALSDVILKKPGGLGREEIIQMKSHTIHGARLFKYVHSPWDRMAAEVALNHHERWDGRGYPGKIDNIFAEIRFGPGKRGKEIPLSARIVSLADVYDALMSKRSYKDSWKEEQAIRYIRVQSGRQFDPEIVALFQRNYDTIRAIRRRYV
jgi:HD-GYP domain-containing protein (c-di-GMP phosphodiesterase class II)